MVCWLGWHHNHGSSRYLRGRPLLPEVVRLLTRAKRAATAEAAEQAGKVARFFLQLRCSLSLELS